MTEYFQVLQAIQDALFVKVTSGELTVEELNAAAVTLLNLREREKMEIEILTRGE